MERKRISKIALVIAVILITCTPFTAFASEADTNLETNLLEQGVIIVDAQGNILPQPKFNIGSAITIPAGATALCNTDCWYNGGKMTFNVAISAGDVEYLEVGLWSPKSYATDFGAFTATSGSWYGKLSTYMDKEYLIDPGKYYKYSLTNTLGAALKVTSFTGTN